jgi:hypothetical protein
MQVIEKIAQQRHHLRQRAGAAARIRAYPTIVMPQQLHDGTGREFGLEPRGGPNGLPQRWSLNNPLGDQASESLRHIRTADHDKSIEGRRLFGHDPISAKSGKAPTERFENRDRGRQPSASRFGNQGKRFADTGIGNRCEQAVVIEGVARDNLPYRAGGKTPRRRARARAKKIELLASRHFPSGYPPAAASASLGGNGL